MAEKYTNKIVAGDEVLIDLTSDTVTAGKMLSGVTAHDKSGAPVTGTCTYDSDTTDATVAVAEILSGKTAYARGSKLAGTMPNNGAVSGSISTVTQQYSVPMGFHDGSGKVQINSVEQAKLIPANIKQGIQVLGVTGSYGGEEIKSQANKDVTPTFSSQTILPDSAYDYLSQVTVAAIPVTRTENSAGGITVTIG